LLYPFRLILRPFLAPDGAAFAAALLPALLIGLLHYVWVVRSSVAFEEASLAASQKMAVRVAAVRAGNWQSLNKRKTAGRAWFRLAPTGPAPMALMWKNLLGVAQVFNRRLMISISVFTLVVAGMSVNSPEKKVGSIAVAVCLGIALGYSLLLGPQFLRLDFRADLPMADILKTYPLRGWQIALGEILAPTVVLAGFQWLLLLLGTFLVFFLPLKPASLYLAIGFGAAIILPPLDGLLFIIPNTAAVLFPAWVPTGKESPRGVEVMGQRIILSLAQLLVMALALVPAAAAFFVVFYSVNIFSSPALAIPPAAAVAALVVAGEAALGIMLLGKCFDRFDVAEDPAT
jgi:ABC-2 type transport system permease protein